MSNTSGQLTSRAERLQEMRRETEALRAVQNTVAKRLDAALATKRLSGTDFMAQVSVTINGRGYDISCDDGQETHLFHLAEEVDRRVASLVASVGQIGDARLLCSPACCSLIRSRI